MAGDDKATKGGVARAKKLQPEERRNIARQAAEARWHPSEVSSSVPVATHPGRLVIGDLVLPCAVLEDGQRVISERAVGTVLVRSGASRRRREKISGGPGLPLAISASNVAPLVSPSLKIALATPIRYKTKNGRESYGLPAVLIPEICEVWLKARDAKLLQKQQEHIATKAEILMRGLAKVGIIALIDEVTHYQETRDRDELNKILAAYISKELLPWTKQFPDEFYEQMFRLWGWHYNPPSVARPKYVARLTSELVYEKLPKGVLKELREKSPIVKAGRRRNRLHRFLTYDVGQPHLNKQLTEVVTLMRVARNRAEFKRLFDRAFPTIQPMLPGLDEDDEQASQLETPHA